MRNLTHVQKKIITSWYRINSEPNVLGNKKFLSVKDFPIDLYKELQKIKDSEVLYQNVENFIEFLNDEQLKE